MSHYFSFYVCQFLFSYYTRCSVSYYTVLLFMFMAAMFFYQYVAYVMCVLCKRFFSSFFFIYNISWRVITSFVYTFRLRSRRWYLKESNIVLNINKNSFLIWFDYAATYRIILLRSFKWIENLFAFQNSWFSNRFHFY